MPVPSWVCAGCSTSGRHAPGKLPTPPHTARPCTSVRAAAVALGVAGSAGDGLARLPPPNTTPTRRLSQQEVLDALHASQHPAQRDLFAAFYSSELGGVVTDPALMVVQADDHMVHRGHAVFDTAAMVAGHLYQLEAHVDRLLASAAKACIPLPPGMSREQLQRVVLETAAASKRMDGYVRYYLSAGRGGFGLSASECVRSALYVVVCAQDNIAYGDSQEHLKGWRVKTSPVPIKPPFFSALKSTNYLPNALNVMDAEAEGFHQGIFVDAAGNVAEGPNMNIAVLLHDGTLVVPPFDAALAGITIQRALALVDGALERGSVDGVLRVERRHLSVGEAKGAAEVMLVGSSLPVMSVVQWDEARIGDGAAGLTALQFRALLQADMLPRLGSALHTEVPYGCLTGMGL